VIVYVGLIDESPVYVSVTVHVMFDTAAEPADKVATTVVFDDCDVSNVTGEAVPCNETGVVFGSTDH
jgi:hypothetical protein